MVSRAGLSQMVADHLLDRIVSGEFAIGSALPPERVLAQQSGASRLTCREAVRGLATQNVLRPVQGMGTYVNPVERWTSVEAIVRMRGDASASIGQLTEVRVMIEVGAAELFAPRVTDAEVGAMVDDVELMQAAHTRGDVPAFVSADIEFHQRILDGCGNPFVAATFQPISTALHDARARTSSVPEIREHAVKEHTRIIEALRTHSGDAAGTAMRRHLQQTTDDTSRYLRPRA